LHLRTADEGKHSFEKALGDLQSLGGFFLIRVPKYTGIAESNGVVGQLGNSGDQRCECEINRCSLLSQLVKVVGSPEGNVMECQKRFGCLLGGLLAVKDRSRRLG
jgi:hypothetical protein